MRIKALRAAFPRTLPVMTGYLFLGIAFGVLLREAGFGPLWALLMSVLIYAGSMQFVAVGLLTGPFAPLTAALVAFTVNARHLFYGLSMLGRFSGRGALKPYLIFGLTDETYSLLCAGEAPEGVDKGWYDFFLTALDQLYWVAGSVAGCVMGAALPVDSTGIDFAMTALFLVIFVEQWESARSHLPALLGVGASAVCVAVFGADGFIPFAMAAIFAGLTALHGRLAPLTQANSEEVQA
ncbi:MAG: AzlC family ABC transporter permease [Oscillospiraceae bacterium]|nr:AzlC family ABC transporter permease [Oscillospiraceae bacterium]